jgi:hypothetical protein
MRVGVRFVVTTAFRQPRVFLMLLASVHSN